MKVFPHLLLSCLLLPLTKGVTAAPDMHDKLERVVSGDHRSAENIARNQYRHPVQTLEFFGMRDDMNVVEIWPGGGGWYTEVLAPFLRDRGKLVAASYDADSSVEYYRKNAAAYGDKLQARPDVYDRVKVIDFQPPDKSDLGADGSADMVVTFRNVHNWLEADTAGQVFAAMFRVLKPGGILGLVEHRGVEGHVGKKWWESGYVPESEVIRLAQEAGFRLVEKSEINANPKDTKDYPDGVWTLPPVYRLKEKDHDRYAAIGESDRMTMKFIKP